MIRTFLALALFGAFVCNTLAQDKPAPAKPEPPKPAPAPAKPEPAKPDSKKPEPPKPAPAPAKPEPAKPDSKKPEPPKPAPAPSPTPQPQAPVVAAAPQPASVQQAPAPQAQVQSGERKKSVDEVVKGTQLRDGLFRIHLNQEKGNIFLYIRKEQLGPEFIYFTHTVNGPVVSGHHSGRFGDATVFTITRSFDKLEFTKQNTAFYFDPQHPLARAAKANISDAVLAREPILAEDAGGYLIAAEPLFFRETLLQVKPQGANALGKLNEAKCMFTHTMAYPDNSFFSVRYVFEGSNVPSGPKDDNDDIADSRYITVNVQHTWIKMPDSDYQPRFEDPRIGYFTTQVTDLTSTEPAPWRDFIHRWRLVKQKPGTKLSEPVKPVTFWIENTTPIEFRDTIKAAVLKWNDAFETAGLKDALVVQTQPDDAKWDAGDINHNVLRWTSSPKPPFGGYGPSFVNPRTGEILGADIMLEFSYLSKRLIYRKVFAEMGLEDVFNPPVNQSLDPRRCDIGMAAQLGMLRGDTTLRLRAAPKMDMDRMIKESLTKLVLHEVGHTLGLNHNFKASHLHDPKAIHDRALTEKVGLYGSVMDYPTINLAPDGTPQGQYFMTCPGPYDHWAIDFGYSEALADPEEEAKRLATIAARSHEPQLAFGNDADDMRVPGNGIDPDVMIFDLSSDPVAYAEQRLPLDEKDLAKLLDTFPANGQSHQELVQAYSVITRDMTDALTAASRYIGGVHVERAVKGQGAARKPLTPVPAEQQKRAMALLARYAFGPQAWKASPELIAHLQQQRRGFELGRETEDPKIHGRIFGIQQSLLSHLMHTVVMQRLIDSSLYGNTYTLATMMDQLTDAIMAGDEPGKPISDLRSNLQTEYLFRLLNLMGSNALPSIQDVVLAQIHRIKASVGQAWPAYTASPAHRDHLLYRIRRGLDEK